MARTRAAPTAPAKRSSGMFDRLQAPTTLKHELMAVGYGTVGVCLVIWALALMRA